MDTPTALKTQAIGWAVFGGFGILTGCWIALLLGLVDRQLLAVPLGLAVAAIGAGVCWSSARLWQHQARARPLPPAARFVLLACAWFLAVYVPIAAIVVVAVAFATSDGDAMVLAPLAAGLPAAVLFEAWAIFSIRTLRGLFSGAPASTP